MNIYDIAKKANVSIATVSRVINKSSNVTEKTRLKVEKVIADYGYKPSDLARGLATKSSKTIGVIIPDIRNSFHGEIAFLIEQKLNAMGFASIISNSTDSISRKEMYIEMMYQKGVDGIILVGSEFGSDVMSDMFEKISNKIPIVVINGTIGKKSNYVICDEKKGMKEAFEFLKKKGYQHPIYVSEKSAVCTRASISKENGYRYAISEVYPENGAGEIYKVDNKRESYEKLVDIVLMSDGKIDSIQFENDSIAIKFMNRALKKGLEIPKKVAIIGFDNIIDTNYMIYSISTIDHKVEEMCEKGVKLLKNLIEGKDVERNIVVAPTFISKETT